MIQFDRDGVTLFYITSSGVRISHNYLEGAAYTAMLDTMDLQQSAAKQNLAEETDYRAKLKKTQDAVDMGRVDQAPPAPTKPLRKLVDDTGGVSYAPFEPPLPDLVIPKTIPSGPIKVETPDRQAIMYNMILAMFRKMFPEA